MASYISFSRIANLTVEPMNIAIPLSLLGETGEGQLMFTFYVQLSEGFLSETLLQLALEVLASLIVFGK